MHHFVRHVAKHTAKFYVRNPHQAVAHAAVLHKTAMHVGKQVWTHGPKVAKHTASFMQKAALRGFDLFRS